jgi:hypothetical protein
MTRVMVIAPPAVVTIQKVRNICGVYDGGRLSDIMNRSKALPPLLYPSHRRPRLRRARTMSINIAGVDLAVHDGAVVDVKELIPEELPVEKIRGRYNRW